MKLDLHPKVVWAMDELAEKRGVSVADLVTEAVLPKMRKPSLVGEKTRADVVRLHGEGLTDIQIAARLGRVPEHVARLRRAAGLKPNKKGK